MRHKVVIIYFFMVFILINSAIAVCPENQEDCRQEFSNNPTTENFEKLKAPTPEDFDRLQEPSAVLLKKVNNPTLDNFDKLNNDEQSKYLLSEGYYKDDFAQAYLTKSRFEKPEDIVIGDKFFSSSNNLNNQQNRDARFKYFNAKGYEFVQFEGDVAEFEPSTELLKLKENGDVTSKDLGILKERYKFKIDDKGDFYLIPKESERAYKVSGEIFGSKDGVSISGIIDGKSIDSAHVTFSQDGIYMQEMREFNGFKVEGEPALGNYLVDVDTLFLTNTRLSDIPVDKRLAGTNVELPDGNLLERGTLIKKSPYQTELFDNTYLRTVNKERLSSGENGFNVYLNEPNFNPQEHKDENYYYSSGDRIIIHTLPTTPTPDEKTKDNAINVEYLAGNEFFDMYINELVDGKIQPVQDEKQKLAFRVANGDVLNMQNRKEENKIPEIEWVTSDFGSVSFENGRLSFSLIDDEVNLRSVKLYKTAEEYEDIRKGQFRSVPLQIKTEKGEHLRINSGNQFVLFREDEAQEVKYNDFGIPVSENLEYNQFKSIEDLSNKYKNIQFTLSPDLKDIDPSLVQILDRWLADNSGSIEKIKSIEFNNKFNAYAISGEDTGKLGFGERALDPYTLAELKIRDNNVFEIINHEYEHLLDHVISNEEKKALEDIVKTDEETGLEPQIPQFKTLEVVYNDIAISSFKKIREDEEFKNLIRDVNNRIEAIDYALYAKKAPEREREARIESLRRDYGNTNPYIEEALSMDKETLEKESDYFTHLRFAIFSLEYKVVKVNGISQPFPRGSDEEMPGYLFQVFNQVEAIGKERSEYKEIHDRMNNLFRSVTGLPTNYGFRDYSEHSFVPLITETAERKFSEISSTFAEIPLQKRKQIIDSGNEVFKQLAQISFDAGKMKTEDYKYLMGQEHCTKPDCCDRKCVTYKLLCKGAC